MIPHEKHEELIRQPPPPTILRGEKGHFLPGNRIGGRKGKDIISAEMIRQYSERFEELGEQSNPLLFLARVIAGELGGKLELRVRAAETLAKIVFPKEIKWGQQEPEGDRDAWAKAAAADAGLRRAVEQMLLRAAAGGDVSVTQKETRIQISQQ